MNFSKAAKSVSSVVRKHSPVILTTIGCLGMVSAVIAGIKATPKAVQRLDEYDVKQVKSGKKAEYGYKTLPLKTKVKLTWRYYAPVAGLTVASIGCVVGGAAINRKRMAALSTAYGVAKTALANEVKKFEAVASPTKVEKANQVEAQRAVEADPPDEERVVHTKHGSTLCYDSVFGRYFLSDMDYIKKAVNEANADLNRQSGYLSVNEMFAHIGLEDVPIGDDLGWHDIVDISWSAIKVPEYIPFSAEYPTALVLRFTVQPKYGYDMYAK